MDTIKQKSKPSSYRKIKKGNPNRKETDSLIAIERLGRLVMSDKELWKLFEKTGSINDYLNYACTCESDYEEENSHEGCHKEDECLE